MMKPITIFIAEDDADDLMIFSDALEETWPDVKIISFKDGDEFITAINSPQTDVPDLFFLDINMPYFTGIECLKQLRDDMRFLRVPVIMFTTSGTREDIMESFYAGATRYITKPNEYRALLDVLVQLFGLYQSNKLRKTDLLNFTLKPFIGITSSTYGTLKTQNI